MYKLYGSPGSGSASVEAALVETGVAYRMIVVNTANGEHLAAPFSAINPRQQVPALVLPDGSVMTEGAAMMLHLADAAPSAGLAPRPGTSERAQHDRWLIFMAVNIYEGELRKAYPERYSTQPDAAPGVAAAADAHVKRQWTLIENAIGGGPYFFGSGLTMVDLYLWMLASWMDGEWLSEHCPKAFALAARIRQRPLVAPVHHANFN